MTLKMQVLGAFKSYTISKKRKKKLYSQSLYPFFLFKIGNFDQHAKYFGLEKDEFINLYTRQQKKNAVPNFMLWKGHLLYSKQKMHHKIFKVLANEL